MRGPAKTFVFSVVETPADPSVRPATFGPFRETYEDALVVRGRLAETTGVNTINAAIDATRQQMFVYAGILPEGAGDKAAVVVKWDAVTDSAVSGLTSAERVGFLVFTDEIDGLPTYDDVRAGQWFQVFGDPHADKDVWPKGTGTGVDINL